MFARHCAIAIAFCCGLFWAQHLRADDPAPLRMAAVVTIYRYNSHADVIVGRVLKTQSLDGKGEQLPLKIVSMYVDQKPETDLSAKLSEEHGFSLHDTVTGALTLGTGKLAVDGVIMVAEHGDYPESETGQTIYPKRRFFTEIAQVFRDSGKSVPVFSDKHLADNWTDAKWIYDTARELKAPLMAGSSLPPSWRLPQVDIHQRSKLQQVVGLSYGGLDAYGFHTLEMMQCLAEKRLGGETGVKSVQAYSGDAVWKAGEDGIYDRELVAAAMSHMKARPRTKNKTLKELVAQPVAFIIEYNDGLRGVFLMLNGAVEDFASAWKYEDGTADSTLFQVDEERPFMHFANLTAGINRLMHEKKAPWPVERTLLSSGMLDAGMISLKRNGMLLQTDYMNVKYQSDWEWKSPPQIPVRTK